MDAIYTWVKSIVFFLLLITIVDNLVESTSYKKYINLISGMILIILVASPFFGLFDIDDKIDYYFEKNTFVSESGNISNELMEIEQAQVSTIFDEYKIEIENKTVSLLKKENLFISYFNVNINEDTSSDSFGKIEKIELVASYKVDEEVQLDENIPKVEIDKIEIRSDIEKNEEDKKNENNSLNSDLDLSDSEIYIKNLLSDFYNVDFDNINISIQES